jgi:hypothetical protein
MIPQHFETPEKHTEYMYAMKKYIDKGAEISG